MDVVTNCILIKLVSTPFLSFFISFLPSKRIDLHDVFFYVTSVKERILISSTRGVFMFNIHWAKRTHFIYSKVLISNPSLIEFN